jgi:transposase InsO family protein
VRTTDSSHDLPIAPNLLDRNFTAEAPNRIWLADITYGETGEGWLYLYLSNLRTAVRRSRAHAPTLVQYSSVVRSSAVF